MAAHPKSNESSAFAPAKIPHRTDNPHVSLKNPFFQFLSFIVIPQASTRETFQHKHEGIVERPLNDSV